MVKNIIQMVVSTGRVVGRAFTKAVQREIEASQQAARARQAAGASAADAHNEAAEDVITGMSIGEAKQILDVEDIEDADSVKKNFDHLFAVNEKGKGGSLYLQSKVVRAKERIDQELGNPVSEGDSVDPKNIDSGSNEKDKT